MGHRLQLVLFLFLTVPSSLAAAADEVSLSPQQGILLLQNGNLVEGTITAAGDRYDVSLKDGEIHIKRSDVALVCRTAEECYLHRRSGLQEGRVQDHLELAEWCLRNGLRESAEKELDEARVVDSTHPKIKLIELRLQLAKEITPSSEPISTGEKTASKEQLDRMARNLPAGSMESFTNTIQPMLLNYCTKAGCHGPQSTNALRLQRIQIKNAGRHLTQRNLQAALALVDRVKPEESKLLQAPLRPHGTAKLPVFTDREHSQYKQLVQWVYLVANSRVSPPPPRSLEERGAPLLQTGPRASAALQGGPEVKAEVTTEPETAPQVPVEPEAEFPQSLTAIDDDKGVTAPHAKRAERPKAFVAKDPFDAEIFNRRYFSR